MHGDVRLAGGQTTNEGRVEICISNQWSTVCGYLAHGDVYGWTLSEALVTCKQLGFDGTIIIVTSTSNKDYAGGDPRPRYGGGTGGNTYSFTCIGHENRLINCESGLLNVGLWCSHDDDAGVTCHQWYTNVPTSDCMMLITGG